MHAMQHGVGGASILSRLKQAIGASVNSELGLVSIFFFFNFTCAHFRQTEPGEIYLFRIDSRMVMGQVIEKGRGYIVLVLKVSYELLVIFSLPKCMELDTTACHAEEGLVINQVRTNFHTFSHTRYSSPHLPKRQN